MSMNLNTRQQKDIFFPMQRGVNKWLETTFHHYTCNYQSFDNERKRVFENYTCIAASGEASLIMIVYNIQEDFESSAWYTYRLFAWH